MGIDIDAHVMIGWGLDFKKTTKFLRKKGVKSCFGEDQPCGCEECWNRQEAGLPEGFTLICNSPYYDCPYERQEWSLILVVPKSPPELAAKIQSADWAAAEKIAFELGAQGKPGVWAEANVW